MIPMRNRAADAAESRKTLVLARMPPEGKPESHLPAGPWCFAGREELFPEWETRFSFAPDVLADAAALERIKRQAWALTARCLPLVAEALGRRQGAELPAAFWETALIPSLLIISQILAERRARTQRLIEHWGRTPLRVPLLPEDCTFGFHSDRELGKGAFFGHEYNHWIFSLLLRPLLPPAWEEIRLPRVDGDFSPSRRPGFRERLRAGARRFVYALPFPRIRGFSPFQSLLFSLALLRNRSADDRSFSPAELAGGGGAPDAPLPFDPLPLFLASLPRLITRARLPKRIPPAARKRVRVANAAFLEDTKYRMRLAAWCGAGHRLVCIQHGGNYGMLRCAAAAPLEEYNRHAFITWGWRAQSPLRGNFIPLPHARVVALEDAHRERADKLVFVGNGMELFPSRLDSRPNPAQIVEYRRAKGRFLGALPPEVLARVLYRPYFDVPAALLDHPWVRERFPRVGRCVGPLDAAMLSCRLMVIDHHGTTLNLAMAAGTPLLLYWDPRAWELCPEAEELLAALRGAGIWHPTPEEAAAKLVEIWGDVRVFWSSAPAREARSLWRERFASGGGAGFNARWMRALRVL
jgi:hypothetical protein